MTASADLPGVRALRERAAGYSPAEERPLGGYLILLATYGSVVAGLTGLARGLGKQPPPPASVKDLAVTALAVQKLTRIITKDSVTTPLRAPFTTYKEPAGPGEVNEEVRGHGLSHAVGELLTCPFCFGVWTSTALAAGTVFAPRFTRLASQLFASVAVADFLQLGYAAAEQAAEG